MTREPTSFSEILPYLARLKQACGETTATVNDVILTGPRDAAAACRFFTRVLRSLKVHPREVITDAAPVYPAVLDDLLPAAWNHVEQYANNRTEAAHGQLKRRLRPMGGLQTDQTAQVVIAGPAFLQTRSATQCGTVIVRSGPETERAAGMEQPQFGRVYLVPVRTASLLK